MEHYHEVNKGMLEHLLDDMMVQVREYAVDQGNIESNIVSANIPATDFLTGMLKKRLWVRSQSKRLGVN